MNKSIFITLCLLLAHTACGMSQTTKTKKMKTNNPLICDPIVGACGVNDSVPSDKGAGLSSENKIKIIYFTDPICSSCWGIEPQLRKLKLEYGDIIEVEYRMGGLLPDWSYNSGGISKPSDVATHWDEASAHYDMPIDGDVWLSDPLDSSYPPSIAFKAAQLQSEEKAVLFMREMREMLFMQRINIAKYENLEKAAAKVGLDLDRFKKDVNGQAKTDFQQDLSLAKSLGVRGFPTLFFVGNDDKKETVYGSRPYPFFEMAIYKLDPNAAKKEYKKDWESLFTKFKTLTAKEFAELSGMPRIDAEKHLNELTTAGKLSKTSCKNGHLWTLKPSNK